MDDREVIEAFAGGGARQAFGPTLHIEGDALKLKGWWDAAFRVSHECFMVRNEAPPEESSVLEDVGEVLTELGFAAVGENLAGLTAITYVELSQGHLDWTVWAADRAGAEAAIAARVGADSTLQDFSPSETGASIDFSNELEGARRIAGLPQSVVVTLGLGLEEVQKLQVGLTQCRFESRQFGELEPEMCGSLTPTVMVIDATTQTGRDFIMELRAVACGRFLPVVAVAAAQSVAGADVALDPASGAETWVDPIKQMLPV